MLTGLIHVYRDLEGARREVLGRRTAESFDLPQPVRDRIRSTFGADLSAREVVGRIIDDVRDSGDEALRRYTRAFDGVEPTDLTVQDSELDAALGAIDPSLQGTLLAVHITFNARFHDYGSAVTVERPQHVTGSLAT